MTDKQALSAYRLRRAEETLPDAEKTLQHGIGPAAVINRAYYVMFYAVWALLLRVGLKVKTAKHIGIIEIFDREFVHTGEFDGHYSKMMHKTFAARQDGDYRDLVVVTIPEAEKYLNFSREFLMAIKSYLQNLP